MYLLNIYSKIHNQKRTSQFFVLISFLITFVVVRVITHLQRDGILPNQHGELHIHHLVPGILLLLISGYIGLSYWSSQRVREFMSILFGIGAALTIDEFALWFFLKDVYWEKQGRDSIDAVIIITILLIIGFTLSEVHGHQWIKRMKDN